MELTEPEPGSPPSPASSLRRAAPAWLKRAVRSTSRRSDGVHTLGYTASALGGRGAAALFFADLTDAIAEERRVAEAQRLAEVGRIAGTMAHELKSPLATVELYANLIRRRRGDPAAGEQLGVIKDQTRLASTVSARSCTPSTRTPRVPAAW